MPNPSSLGQRAFEHVQRLVVEIGPRPAGSAAERQAFDDLAGRLKQWGYTVETQSVAFAPHPRFFVLFAQGGFALLLGSVTLFSFPLLALLAPALIAVLPDLAREVIRRAPRSAHSQNLLAYTSADPRAPTLLLVAHVDSAPASAFTQPALLWLHQNLMFVALRVAWAVAAVAALQLTGLSVPAFATWLASGAGALIGGVWVLLETLSQWGRGARWSPGAHDNASGVGVLLALAEHFAAQPPARQRVGFLFTGAEETGLHGAEAFDAQPELAGQRVAVLNLDMVGAGSDLRYVTQDGALRPRLTSARLNALIQQADPDAQPISYALRSGDYLPFLRRGLPVGSLQTSGARSAELAYHTVNDSIENIELEALGRTAQAVVKVVELAELQGFPPLPPLPMREGRG
jgi:hypothetical protein